MKKMFFLLLLVCSMQLRGQTKEGAIDWINTYAADILKSKKHFGADVVSVTINCSDDGTLTIVYEKEIKSTGWTHKDFTYELHLKNVIIDTVLSNPFGWGLKINTKPKCVQQTDHWGKQSLTDTFYLCSSDEKSVIRVRNAIMHLAKLFGATPAVKRDTF